ncbi:MAG: ergothioneine biosynthesis protein EgtC [Myxococcales bacterium]|nr:ergothioneine biosynthesis protein EgtC [Myxococcales bacterium]
MCRLLAYVGPPVPLARLLLLGEPSLLEQSYRPRQMTEALLNADGFGVAWYTAVDPAPARYRSALPMWNDENVPSIAPHIASGRVLAALRSATPGVGFGLMNTPPFVNGRYAFAHNGLLEGFADGVGRRLREGLGERAYRAILGSSDSEHLFACVLDALFDGQPLDAALRRMVARVHAVRAEVGAGLARPPDALLTCMLTDGHAVVALRHAIGARPAPTLSVLRAPWGEGGALLASEPTTSDPRWEPVAPGTIVSIAADGAVAMAPC